MNTITIELCAEDRARLDRIIEGLQLSLLPKAEAELINEPAEEPKTAPKTEEEKPQENIPIETETKAEPTKEEPVKPTVTPAEVQAKVVSLVQSGKRDEVKSIVTAYAPRVGEIPEDKLTEVMDKLTALEG
jgi:hypothetical protein